MKAVFLVGLCGSGKTRLAKKMVKEGFEWVEGFVGDPMQFGVLVEHLKAGKNCVGEELQTIRAHFREESPSC